MMFVAAAYIDISTKDCQSLKEKRNIIKSLIHKAQVKFKNVAFAELGNANNFRKISIGISSISNDQKIAEKILLKAIDFIEENSFRTIIDSKAQVFAL